MIILITITNKLVKLYIVLIKNRQIKYNL